MREASMKLAMESGSLMSLKDYNASHFMGGLIFLLIGPFIAFFFGTAELLVLGIGAIFSFVGLWLVISTKLVSISLDKGMNRARFSLRSILKNEKKEVPLSDIKGLTLQKEIVRSSNGKSRRQFSLAFVLADGEELPFEFGSVSGTMDVLTSPEEGIRKQAQQVAGFLGVPLKRIGPPSTSESLSMIKDAMTKGMEGAKKGTLE
jgi:hypothetical protein